MMLKLERTVLVVFEFYGSTNSFKKNLSQNHHYEVPAQRGSQDYENNIIEISHQMHFSNLTKPG